MRKNILSALVLMLSVVPAFAITTGGDDTDINVTAPPAAASGADSARHAAMVFEKSVIRDKGWSTPLGIAQVWALYAEFHRAGYDTRYLHERRAVVVLTGATAGPVPAGWDLDAQALEAPYVLAARDNLDATIARLGEAGYDYLLILDPSRRGQVATLRNLAPQGDDDSGRYFTATAARRQEQEVGIYYLDHIRHQLFRSRVSDSRESGATVYGGLDEQDARVQRTALALADWQRPLEGNLLDADHLLPARLNQPVGGSAWQDSDLARLLSEDEAGFAHRLQQESARAATANAALAATLGLELPGAAAQDDDTATTDDADGSAVAVADALPDNADCDDYATARDPAQLAADWREALAAVADTGDGGATGSYVLMDAHEQLGNLRETLAHAGDSGDRATAMTTALQALADTAGYLDAHLALAPRRVDPDTVNDAGGYYRARLHNAAFNRVAERAGALRPSLVAGLYRVYQYVYSERGALDGESTAAVLAQADAMLRELGRSVVTQDRQLTAALNDQAGATAQAAVLVSVDAHCAPGTQTAQTDDDEATPATADTDQAGDDSDDNATADQADNSDNNVADSTDDGSNQDTAATDADRGTDNDTAGNTAASDTTVSSSAMNDSADDTATDDNTADDSAPQPLTVIARGDHPANPARTPVTR